MAKLENRTVARVKDYKITFGSVHGQRVLNDLIQTCHVLGPCFVKGDVHEAILREGERNSVLRILAILKVDPMKLQEKIKEAQKEESDYE